MKCEDIEIGTLVCEEGAIYPYNQLKRLVRFEKNVKHGGKDDPYYGYQPDAFMIFDGVDNGREYCYAFRYGEEFGDTICKDNKDRVNAILKERLKLLNHDLSELIGEHLDIARSLGSDEDGDLFVNEFKKFIKDYVRSITKSWRG